MSSDISISTRRLQINDQYFRYYPLELAPGAVSVQLSQLPYSIRILLEGTLRKTAEGRAKIEDVLNLIHWQPQQSNRPTIPVFPGRVILQDFTGVPVVNDLAAMRSALVKRGGEPKKINPVVPVDLVIDHSVQVDYYGSPDAYRMNATVEFSRNRERYEFLHWAQQAFDNFKVVPPASGIVHQVNLEYLGKVVLTKEINGEMFVFPDTLVGTDSHTTMINGLGVVGWGVGGIEAVAAMLGEPIEIVAPDVIGVRFTGKLPEGVTPTDLTLTVIQKLRKLGVVDKFIEFFGPGLDHVTLADRAMIANMTPECGATVLYFPVDERTLDYMRLTGRPDELIDLVKAYYQAQGLWRTSNQPEPVFTQVLEIDLSEIVPSLAGPKRPQDRVALNEVKDNFNRALTTPRSENGFGVNPEETGHSEKVHMDGMTAEIGHGSVVIAAITSCTNTSNPFVMLAAGLLAQKAVARGLKTKPYVKTSLAPGSRVVTDYLAKARLMEPLVQLGFDLVGYGCTTCIGNSGPLDDSIVNAVKSGNLVVGAVLSGNRNFEGRVSPHTRANYLASPPLVVAYALAGTLDINFNTDPIGIGSNGHSVYLKDIWPSSLEVQDAIRENITPAMFIEAYAALFTMSPDWQEIRSEPGQLYSWKEKSTYIQEPPFFDQMTADDKPMPDFLGARVLVVLGDSITTDHISPAGSIPVNSAAGEYLISKGIQPSDFNSFGSRRGNDRVMTRGTFGNIRLKNHLVPGVEGSFTRFLPTNETMSIYDASTRYQQAAIPLVVLAGKEYGTGSSRDWAAKGVLLLGVKAVLAESFERIHRSNLAGMGVLPLQYLPGENAASLGLTGEEIFDIQHINEHLVPGAVIDIDATHLNGKKTRFQAILRLDTAIEVTYYQNGGIMPALVKKLQAA
ncbi:MAG: aconitate hydratase AcnA [Bellilinea sp.]